MHNCKNNVAYLAAVQMWKTRGDLLKKHNVSPVHPSRNASRHNKTRRSLSKASELFSAVLIIKCALRRNHEVVQLSEVSLFTCRLHVRVQSANLQLSHRAFINIPTETRERQSAVKSINLADKSKKIKRCLKSGSY